MSISRVKPGTWSLGEKLSSAQANQLDINTTYALDRRSGQTDVCASNVTYTGTSTFSGALTCSGATTFTSTVAITGASA